MSCHHHKFFFFENLRTFLISSRFTKTCDRNITPFHFTSYLALTSSHDLFRPTRMFLAADLKCLFSCFLQSFLILPRVRLVRIKSHELRAYDGRGITVEVRKIVFKMSFIVNLQFTEIRCIKNYGNG